MNEIKEKIKKLKKMKIIFILVVVFLFFLIVTAAMIAVIPGAMNGIQSVGQNSSSSYVQNQTGYETGKNSLFSTLCQDCDTSGTNEKNGVLGSDFYKKMSEIINLYNSLEYQTERIDEFDFELISATVQYGKLLKSELFTDSDKFGTWYNEKNLTNKDIDSFYGINEIDKNNAQKFFKWASVMLGTPYSLPDINLRGLSGSLITGFVTTTCASGESLKSKDEQEKDLIEQIIKVEKKFSGEQPTIPNIFDSILSFFGLSYTNDDKLLTNRLKAMFNGNKKDLEPFINLENYNANKQCPGGSAPKHTYTKFMNYPQYKVYLETVFVPQNYINCETCIWKNASEYNKKIKIQDIIRDIFKKAEYFHTYAGMKDFKYDNITYGTAISNDDLSAFSSPIKSKCAVTSPYGYRNGVLHAGVDTKITEMDKSVYAIADEGKVIIVDTSMTGNLWDETKGGCALVEDDIRNNGVYIVIQHEINGKTYYAQYGHLSNDGVSVKVGDIVKKGQKIANIGNTGCSSGEHLHFSLFIDNYSNDAVLNPTSLFSQCENSGMTTELKLTTTDNYVYPEKCMVDKYTLDEIITSMIKAKDSKMITQKEAVKAAAIVIRTKLMNETDWCNHKINYSVKNLDIEANPLDLSLYNQVIETQGMVLNYSGETIDNADYATFPCNYLPRNDWKSHKGQVLPAIGISEQEAENNPALVLKEIDKYNEKYCVRYDIRGDSISLDLKTIPNSLVENKGIEDAHFDSIPRNMITKTEKGAQGKFSFTIARNLAALGDDYTEILYRFYHSKATNKNNKDESHGIIDLSTAPGLIDAKKKVSENLKVNSQTFKYGETLSEVATQFSPGNISDDEVATINAHLNNYVNNAEQNAIAAGDINPKRARVLAAAYWLINNPFYRVTYEWGTNNANYIGWNPRWSASEGIECSGLVVWSFKQAGANYNRESDLRDGVRQDSGNRMTYLGVEDLVSNPNLKIGDIMYKSYPTDGTGNKIGNGHWALLYEINVEECYIITAEAVSKDIGLRFKKMYCGQSSGFNRVYIGESFYQDAAWGG